TRGGRSSATIGCTVTAATNATPTVMPTPTRGRKPPAVNALYSSNRQITEATATVNATDNTPHHTRRMRSGSRIKALVTRTNSEPLLVGEPAEAAFALSIITYRLTQLIWPKVGPVDRRCPIFTVGSLPDQEIRKAPLAARANDQVRIGHTPS